MDVGAAHGRRGLGGQIAAGLGASARPRSPPTAISRSPPPPATPWRSSEGDSSITATDSAGHARDPGLRALLRPQRSARRAAARRSDRLRVRDDLAADSRLLSRARLDVDAGPPSRPGWAVPATIVARRRWPPRSRPRSRPSRAGICRPAASGWPTMRRRSWPCVPVPPTARRTGGEPMTAPWPTICAARRRGRRGQSRRGAVPAGSLPGGLQRVGAPDLDHRPAVRRAAGDRRLRSGSMATTHRRPSPEPAAVDGLAGDPGAPARGPDRGELGQGRDRYDQIADRAGELLRVKDAREL